jgi:RNA polymerase sigma-70 factor (ECF subfamily)
MNDGDDFVNHLNRLTSKEASAYEDFIALYTKMTYAYMYGILGNKEDAEDVVQEAFLKLYMLDKEQFPSRGEKSWYYKFCTNLARDYRRKIKFTENLDEHILFLAVDDENIRAIESESTYFSAVSGLSEIDRNIVGLKLMGGLKHREIAEILEKPEGTIRWRYMRAIHSLRIILGSVAVAVMSWVALLTMPPRAIVPSERVSQATFLFIVLYALITLSLGSALYLSIGSIRRKSKIL